MAGEGKREGEGQSEMERERDVDEQRNGGTRKRDEGGSNNSLTFGIELVAVGSV